MNTICPICIKKVMLTQQSISSVCNKCYSQYLVDGILFINNNTGSILILKYEMVRSFYTGIIPPNKIIECSEELLESIKLIADVES